MLRSEDRGDNWTKISPDLDGGALRKLSESPLDSKRLVAGGRRRVYFTSDGGETWEQRSKGLPEKSISDVVTSHHNPEGAYVAMSGSSDGNPTSFLYVTDDFGKTWKPIGSQLPHETVYAIAEDSEVEGLLFAGTELGVYASLDSGETWESLCATFPPAPVFDLQVHGRDGALVAATHGLSIFLLEIEAIRRAAESQ